VSSARIFDVGSIREDFPILCREVHGKPLVYFDTASSAQRPLQVIGAVDDFYRRHNANVHRGVHSLSQEATDLYEGARGKLARFINANSEREIVFTRGTTEAVNLVAQSFLRPRLQPGDEILVSHMEHHANIVPWQMLCEQTGAVLKVIPINNRGELEMEALPGLLSERVKLLGLVHISNALGTINPVAEVCRLAKSWDIPVLIDGAQAIPHGPVDVQAAMPPWQGGGEMILKVTFEQSTWNDVPAKFEAGTPHIAGAVGLGAAVDYLSSFDPVEMVSHEKQVLDYATGKLEEIDGLRIIGTAGNKAGVISFIIDDIHPHDLGTVIDHHGIALRTGHHCAMPVMQFFGVPATARVSFGLYNTRQEVDALIEALHSTRGMFA